MIMDYQTIVFEYVNDIHIYLQTGNTEHWIEKRSSTIVEENKDKTVELSLFEYSVQFDLQNMT